MPFLCQVQSRLWRWGLCIEKKWRFFIDDYDRGRKVSYGGAMNLAYFGRKHFMYLLSVSFRIGTNQITCVQILHIDLIALLNEPLCTYWMQHISGGLVMDWDGDVAGMTFDCASPKTCRASELHYILSRNCLINLRYKTTRNLMLLSLWKSMRSFRYDEISCFPVQSIW